jgi:hypothetical protein
MRSLLTVTTADGDPAAAEATWNELIALALSDAGRATSYTREKLPHHLLRRHERPSGFSNGVSLLLEHTEVVSRGIRTTIADKTAIPRRELFANFAVLLERFPSFS